MDKYKDLSPAQRAVAMAADETLKMFELVHFIPTADGVGRFAPFQKRLRFIKREHALQFASRSKRIDFFHYAIIEGTRKEIETTPGVVSQAELLDFEDVDPVTKTVPLPSEYRFGVAIVDCATSHRLCDMVDGEVLRYTTKEAAERVKVLIEKRFALLPNFKEVTNIELRVVEIYGMDDVKISHECEK
jgi:hypothetical protein